MITKQRILLIQFLYQLVNEPTKGSNILDLVLTNKDNFIGNLEIGGPLGNSDHSEIRCECR